MISSPEADAFSFAERFLQNVADRSFELVAEAAQTLQELKDAYRLVYREYLQREYCMPDNSQMHFTFYCLLPESKTFLLKKEGEILGAMSLIVDSPCGLPMESVFGEEIQSIRGPEKQLAEISLLAVDNVLHQCEKLHLANFRKFYSSFLLFKEMFRHARQKGVTDLVISIHPKQEKFYHSLSFQTVATPRPYQLACGSPAIAMHMNIHRWFRIVPDNHLMKRFFLELTRQREEAEQNHFVWDAESVSEILREKTLQPSAYAYLEAQYPGLSLC